MSESSIKDRVYSAAERLSANRNPTVATVREAAGVSNADATRYLKEWRAERDSAGSKIAAPPPTITEQALRLAGTVWEEAVRTATAEHAIIEKAWRDEKAHKDREINELATDLDTVTRTHEETNKELKAQVEQSNQAARDNAAAAAEAREQIALAARQYAEDIAELKSQLTEAQATITALQKTQDALIARIEPQAKDQEEK
ncbi:MAG: DNA-binding protein [Specibacter sp.]